MSSARARLQRHRYQARVLAHVRDEHEFRGSDQTSAQLLDEWHASKHGSAVRVPPFPHMTPPASVKGEQPGRDGNLQVGGIRVHPEFRAAAERDAARVRAKAAHPTRGYLEKLAQLRLEEAEPDRPIDVVHTTLL